MVCVCVGDLAAVVVEPQEVDSKWLKAFIACACARGTWIIMNIKRNIG